MDHSPWFRDVSPVLLSGRTRTLTSTFPLISFGLELGFPVSSASSKVVALVEQEPWAEELLLWVGDASGSRASPLDMNLPSPLPLSNDGVFELR
jgi:hypothetical protein